MSIEKTYDQCREIREGVGRYGDWAIDFHTRYEMNEAVTLCNMIEPLRPFFVDDLIRSENPAVYRYGS